MDARSKATELIEMHKPLTLGNGPESFAVTYCDCVLRGNTALNDNDRNFWLEVKQHAQSDYETKAKR